MTTSVQREALAPLSVNVLGSHAPLKIKVPKRKLSTCSISTTEAELPFSVYSGEFPVMPNSRNSTLYSPNSTSKYKDLDQPPFPPSTAQPRSDPPSPSISPPTTEDIATVKLHKTNRLPARKPFQYTSSTSPISPQFRYQLHAGAAPASRAVSDVTGLTRSRSSQAMKSIPAPPTSSVTVTKKRSRERNAITVEKSQRDDGFSRKFTQARINSDLTHNRGRNASSPRSQYAVFRAEAERVRGLTDLNARPDPKVRTTSARSNCSFATLPTTSAATIDVLDSNSFTISTLDKRCGIKKSYSTKPTSRHFAERSLSRLPRNISQPPARVTVRRGPRPMLTQRATSEMVHRRPSARGRTRSEVEAPMAGNVQLNELRDQVERGIRQRRVWMLRGKMFKRWQKVHARIEDCSTLVIMRNGIIKHYRLRCAIATPAPDLRTFKIKGGARLTAFKIYLDNDKVLTFATEYATEADSWIYSIQQVGDPGRNPIWNNLA